MSIRMYEPDKKSRVYLYVVFFTAVFLAIGAYFNFRPLEVQHQCSEMALRTSGLTKDFKFDPYSSYDYIRAKCESDVLSASK